MSDVPSEPELDHLRVAPPPEHLSPDEFVRAVREGRGRAVAHLRRWGAGGHARVVLDSCLPVPRPPPDVGHERREWFVRLVEAAADHDSLVLHVADRLDAESGTAEKARWRVQAAVALAARGHRRVRHAVRRVFDRGEYGLVGAQELIACDGAKGLIQAAARIAEDHAEEDGARHGRAWWHAALAWNAAKRHIGSKETEALLHSAAIDNPRIEEFVALVPRETTEPRPRRERRAPASGGVLFSVLRQRFRDGRARGTEWVRFAQAVPAEEADEARRLLLADLAKTDDPGVIRRYLSIFLDDPPPGLPGCLSELACSADAAIAVRARRVLARCEHPDVRDVALGLLRDAETAADIPGVIAMLARTYREGDHRVIASLLRPEVGEIVLARVCTDLAEMATGQPDRSELTPLVLWGYERCPFERPRGTLARWLKERGGAPAWVAAECSEDLLPATRALFEPANQAERIERDG